MLQTRRPALSGNALKGIAILAMTLDHLTWTLWPGYTTDWWVLLLHLLGRVTAPIMWFFVVEGYHYTHDVKKYAARLFALAFISHFAYDFCFGIPFVPLSTGPFNQTGVVWSLAWGLVLLGHPRRCAAEGLGQDRADVCDLRHHVPVGLELRGRDGDPVHGTGTWGLPPPDVLAHGVVGRVRARVFLLYR